MTPILPSWFKQRQGKAEPAGTDTYRLYGPNLREAFLSVRRADNGQWSAALRYAADGPDAITTQPVLPTEYDAWEAAFELYREEVVV
ncbi:MAG TPA: hypothetical protein VEL76_00805 [Gemmataceae bacterium]|nr:hypothetical protein [Gemmataceae bacterium]